jgi:hypothetical protein
MFSTPLTQQLVEFVRGIGIDVQPETLDASTLFGGLGIRCGTVLVDETRLVYPGTLLHEAGHLAVAEPHLRNLPDFSPAEGEELATIAWEYAAILHLGLPVEVVFHPGSYRGDEIALIENFAVGRFIGVPLLQYFGMTVEPRFAAERGVRPFPHMLRWVR